MAIGSGHERTQKTTRRFGKKKPLGFKIAAFGMPLNAWR